MKSEIKKKWVEALRSGGFKQGRGRLYNSGPRTYCCLGVLCRLYLREKKKGFNSLRMGADPELLPSEVMSWAGLNSDDPYVEGGGLYNDSPNVEAKPLSAWNDSFKYNFKQIAGLIEEDL